MKGIINLFFFLEERKRKKGPLGKMAHYKPCSNEWLISWENKKNNNILPVHQIILQHLSQCDQHLNKPPSDWTQPAGADWRWRLVPRTPF